jgi:hypothetical protein
MDEDALRKLLKTPVGWVGDEARSACQALGSYLTALSDHIDTVRAQFRLREDVAHKKRLAELSSDDLDPNNVQTRYEYEYLLEIEKKSYEREKAEQDRLILQLAWNSFVVSCWATFEMYFEGLADYVWEEEKDIIKIRANDLKGDKIDRVKKYFASVLNLELMVKGDDFEYLHNLYLVRNAVVHGNGAIHGVFEHKRKQLCGFVESNPYIELAGGSLRFGEDFGREAFTVVNRALKEINNAVRQHFGYAKSG